MRSGIQIWGGGIGDRWQSHMRCGSRGAAALPVGGLLPMVVATPMGRVRISGFGGDCSPSAVEEVGGDG
jgi:hypothetical protein